MNFKNFFNNARSYKASRLNASKQANEMCASGPFVDFETMACAPQLTEEEVLTKVRTERFAEMSFYHAGTE